MESRGFMRKDLQYYFDNYDRLTDVDIYKFILLLIEIEKQKLDITTKIDLSIFDVSRITEDKTTGGFLESNFKCDSNKKVKLPLETDYLSLALNEEYIKLYKLHKGDLITLEDGTNLNIGAGLNALLIIAKIVSHEMRHAFQSEQLIKNKCDNPEAILWLKEALLRYYYSSIYDDNYESVFVEQDAYHYQGNLPIELLEQYVRLDPQIMKVYKQYLERKDFVSCKEKNFLAQFKDLNDATQFRIGTAYITELFNEIAKNLPKEYLENSILKYEYNSDGTKKTYVELLRDMEEHKKMVKI